GDDVRAEALTLADETDPHVASIEFVDLALQCVHEQLHQRADLILRAAPVLAREREQGQRLDLFQDAEVDADVDRPRARAMADDAWPVAALGPASVAIHDDGQVAGDGGSGWYGCGHGNDGPG